MLFNLNRLRLSRHVGQKILLVGICFGFLLNFLILWIIYSQDEPIVRDRPKFCSRKLISEHFMFNESVRKFVTHDPVQSEFSYKIPNEDVCQSTDSPDVLIFVLSKSNNFHSRQAIRRTWGNLHFVQSLPEYKNLKMKLLFFLDIDESLLMKIEMEQTLFNDLVQVRLPQDYSLSSYRDISILHWTEKYCPQVQLTFKTDDDIFLNIFLLANIFQRIFDEYPKMNSTNVRCDQIKLNDPSAMMFGYRIDQAVVVRSNHDSTLATSRYIVTDDEYPCEFYPSYLSGFGYIVNRQARRNLLCIYFRSEHIFSISDVYLTGILAEYLNISRRSLPVNINSRVEEDCRNFFTNRFALVCATLSHHLKQSSTTNVDHFEIFNFYWNIINDRWNSYRIRFPFH